MDKNNISWAKDPEFADVEYYFCPHGSKISLGARNVKSGISASKEYTCVYPSVCGLDVYDSTEAQKELYELCVWITELSDVIANPTTDDVPGDDAAPEEPAKIDVECVHPDAYQTIVFDEKVSSEDMLKWLKRKAREAELMDEYKEKYGILWESKYPEIAETLRIEFGERDI